ncbi:MAG: aminopeptidase N [Pseudomonadota bacterium]|nr:aminopeptidase N [Pseudomonadota bacterium]
MQANFKKIKLKEYKPPDFSINSCEILFKIKSEKTVVTTKIYFFTKSSEKDLVLDGTNLDLKWVKVNGEDITIDLLKLTENSLTIPNYLINQEAFIFECATEIDPKTNRTLEGLYYSSNIYCTQCEPEGFRKITYFLDRPDVLTRYKVRIEAADPVLLSNGNLVSKGEGYAEWSDPWPKPSYLFALVAGNLEKLEDHFITQSGRKVKLQIFTKPGKENLCEFAMTSLQRAMRWDEIVYSREYDLDIFMIVAIDDFNSGAMENKGLNIFNSKYILADKNMATDVDFENIERIIAHEYFHNWTGNRITCRDWFQLCLKEGLTVYRDQAFTAFIRNAQLERIKIVKALQSKQFHEDDGPLSHPVRPEEYLEINNFYTSTVYEKGAELVRMLELIVGKSNYQASVQDFFNRFDGSAATVEDWLGTFEEVTKLDLRQFFLWYKRRGRPEVRVQESYAKNVYTLKFTQLSQKNDGVEADPLQIPIVVGLLTNEGKEILKDKLIILDKLDISFSMGGLNSKPIASVLRGLSAPVSITFDQTELELLTIAKHDTDAVNRLMAIEELYLRNIEKLIMVKQPVPNAIFEMFSEIAEEDEIDLGLKSQFLKTPSAVEIMKFLCRSHKNIDPDVIIRGARKFRNQLAHRTVESLKNLYGSLTSNGTYDADHEQTAIRDLKLRLLDLLCYVDPSNMAARELFNTASNMTEEIGALRILIRHKNATQEVAQFYAKWENNELVIDKWFSAQAIYTPAEIAPKAVQFLTKHKNFNWQNPNRFNSLILGFATSNLGGFHQKEGEGYDLVCSWIAKTDSQNPQLAARLASTFERLRIFDKDRQKKIERNLSDLLNMNNISRNTFEIISKILNS